METAGFSGTLVNYQQQAQRHMLEDAKLKYKIFARKYNNIHSNYYDVLSVTGMSNILALP
jgi:hypothetical protein